MLIDGAYILCSTPLQSDVIKRDDTVLGVSVVNKSGHTDIFAKVVIDASGDGDIAAMSGS